MTISDKKCLIYCDSKTLHGLHCQLPAIKFHGFLLNGLWAICANHQWAWQHENPQHYSFDVTKYHSFLQFTSIFVSAKQRVRSCGHSVVKSWRFASTKSVETRRSFQYFAFAKSVEEGRSIQGAGIQLRALCFCRSLEEGRSLQSAAGWGYSLTYFELQVLLFL